MRNKNKQSDRFIQGLLVAQGFTQTELAKELGVLQSAVAHVISGRSKSTRIRNAIAAALCMPVEQLWPDANRPGKRGRKPKLKSEENPR